VIVVDTSAIIAIARHEPEEPIFIDILDRSANTIMSAVSFLEAHMVLVGRRSRADLKAVDSTVSALGIEIVDVTRDQTALAINGFVAYGKGRHPAHLNLADCFTYALAKSRDAPLLFKGEDFIQTDIVPAWRPAQ
jgi:ribonuclease VapC